MMIQKIKSSSLSEYLFEVVLHLPGYDGSYFMSPEESIVIQAITVILFWLSSWRDCDTSFLTDQLRDDLKQN